jgi:hypothetical protein
MSMKHLIVNVATAMAVALPSTLFAQTAAAPQGTDSAEQYKHMKVDEATAADSKFHANRTETNMIARDKAEAEASAAIERANGPTPQEGQR